MCTEDIRIFLPLLFLRSKELFINFLLRKMYYNYNKQKNRIKEKKKEDFEIKTT